MKLAQTPPSLEPSPHHARCLARSALTRLRSRRPRALQADLGASLTVQGKYPVLYLSGPVHWTPEWKSLVWNGLLATGGWLVLDVNPIHDAIYSDLGNPPLLAFVPGYAADQIGMANVLAGHVVRIGSPAHYPALVAELGRRFLPFSIAAADFALNSLRPDSWIVTLINDSGIDKAPRTPAVVTQGPETISVVPNGKKIKNAFVLRSASAPAWTADGLQVAVAAGDTAVIRIDLQ